MCRCSKLLLLLLVVVVLVMPVDVGAVVEVEAEMWRWRGTNGGGVEPATLKLRSRGLTGRAGATSSWWRRWNWRTRNHFLDDFNVGKTIIFRLLFRLVLAKIWTVTSGRTFDQIALVFLAFDDVGLQPPPHLPVNLLTAKHDILPPVKRKKF